MTGRFKLLLSLLTALILVVALQLFFYMYHKSDTRENSSLLNQYYLLSKADPAAARRALEIIIKNDPKNKTALRELAYSYLKNGNTNEALQWFKSAFENDPNDFKVAFELGKLYWVTGNNIEASNIFATIIKSGVEPVTEQARQIMMRINASNLSRTQAKAENISYPMSGNELTEAATQTITEQNLSATSTGANNQLSQTATISQAKQTGNASQSSAQVTNTTISERDQMLNKFYDLKNKNSPTAWDVIRQGAEKFPNDVQVLKEAGYYALLTLKDNELSLNYFNRVYLLTKNPKIALQVAYLYDGLGQKRLAYHYFDLATDTTDIPDRMTAELAKSNLRGVQTKFLPYPYEATLDYSPLYMSRFKLLIQPIIFHLGLTVNKPYNWKVYLSYRRSSDNQSSTNDQISSIYEDNAAITAIGTSLTPFKSIPQLVAFSEVGKAVDIVYQNRSRWRTDFRGGVAYYNEWGFKPDYTLKPTFMLKPNADVYGDAIYFTRYLDTIGTLRFRPGVKVFRWGSTSIDLYYRLFLIQDVARQFYNNLFEQGPGVAIRFSDRYNVVLRYEQNHGHYLPAGSPSPNPYSQNYYNGVTQLNTYFEF